MRLMKHAGLALVAVLAMACGSASGVDELVSDGAGGEPAVSAAGASSSAGAPSAGAPTAGTSSGGSGGAELNSAPGGAAGAGLAGSMAAAGSVAVAPQGGSAAGMGGAASGGFAGGSAMGGTPATGGTSAAGAGGVGAGSSWWSGYGGSPACPMATYQQVCAGCAYGLQCGGEYVAFTPAHPDGELVGPEKPTLEMSQCCAP